MSKTKRTKLVNELIHAKVQLGIWHGRAIKWAEIQDGNWYRKGRLAQAEQCEANWRREVVRIEKFMREEGIIQKV